MTELAPLILSLVETLIRQEPQIAGELQQLFAKPNPTADDWDAMRARIAGQSYKKLVPHTQLPE